MEGGTTKRRGREHGLRLCWGSICSSREKSTTFPFLKSYQPFRRFCCQTYFLARRKRNKSSKKKNYKLQMRDFCSRSSLTGGQERNKIHFPPTSSIPGLEEDHTVHLPASSSCYTAFFFIVVIGTGLPTDRGE